MVLAFSSCQSIDDFVVINRSDAPVEVTYVFIRASLDKYEEPRIMNAEDMNRSWEAVPRDQFLIEPQDGRVTVQLGPGKALLLRSVSNYRKEKANADAVFGISSLSLVGARGSIRLEGRQARMLFKFEKKRHVITYE